MLMNTEGKRKVSRCFFCFFAHSQEGVRHCPDAVQTAKKFNAEARRTAEDRGKKRRNESEGSGWFAILLPFLREPLFFSAPSVSQ